MIDIQSTKSIEKRLAPRGRIAFRRDNKIHKKICSLKGSFLLSAKFASLLWNIGINVKIYEGKMIWAEWIQDRYTKTKTFERLAEMDYHFLIDKNKKKK